MPTDPVPVRRAGVPAGLAAAVAAGAVLLALPWLALSPRAVEAVEVARARPCLRTAQVPPATPRPAARTGRLPASATPIGHSTDGAAPDELDAFDTDPLDAVPLLLDPARLPSPDRLAALLARAMQQGQVVAVVLPRP